MRCENGVCYFSKEINLDSVTRAFFNAEVLDIKESGKEVVVKVNSSHFGTMTIDDIKRQLQGDNPQVEIIYDDERIDENIQKDTKPIWGFKVEDNFICLKRV